MPKIHFLFFDAGGGHRSAATALNTSVADMHPDWSTDLVNIGKLLEPLDFFHKYAGIAGEDVYNRILQHELTLGSVAMLRVAQEIVKLHHKQIVRLMTGYWHQTRPDLVVSLIPNFNKPLFEALTEACPATPYMTVLTDLADFPPHFWMEQQPQYVVCGTVKAVAQAKTLGYTEHQIFQASGMILQPRFYQPQSLDIAEERERLGLHPHRTTALVLFGGHGAAVMEHIRAQLERSCMAVQGIFVCGRNERLAAKLNRASGRMPAHVVGFTKEIPRLMRISDFFIGKPGPGSLSEAIQMNLPVIVQRNAWTLPQERYNAEWITENQVGIVLRSFRAVAKAVEDLLADGRLEQYRKNTAGIRNRAVFEVPRFMELAMEQGPATRRLAEQKSGRLGDL
ncbi:MAG: galactosyldiacylglycerol synthase [Bryobacterales bacterium]|nr:galactosyldiacylglycerol synthase [Bryobacterales bacterium]